MANAQLAPIPTGGMKDLTPVSKDDILGIQRNEFLGNGSAPPKAKAAHKILMGGIPSGKKKLLDHLSK